MKSLALVIPFLLIHGYSEDSHVWDSWKGWLKQDGFKDIQIPTFSQDQCGNVADKAAELSKIIGDKSVNLVTHSQGGLVARWFISHYSNNVKNLIMIATPNQGTWAAWLDLTNCPFISNSSASALEDLKPGSAATTTKDSSKTHYYTIGGNYPVPCYFVLIGCAAYDNDGLVELSSAQSHYPILGVFPYNHTGLLTHKEVYDKAIQLLKNG